MSIRSSSCAVAALVLLGSAVLGQTASQLPAFEVVSIKPRTGDRVPPPAQAPPDRFVRSNTTVVQLVQYAYGMQEFQVIGGPDWVRSNRYEVSAKAESATTADRLAQMVKRMLAERFGLQTHTEMREQNTYALVPARGDRRLGERMRPSAIDCAPIIDAGKVVPPKPGGPPAQCFWFVAMMNGANRMRVDGIRMPRFAMFLEAATLRKVADKTGFTETYDIDLEFLPDRGFVPAPPPPGVTQTAETPSLLTALQDQLGLKLESERGPVEVIIIDSAQLPTPN
jgi:uncharacterized protein (TIGR03435 family)